MVERSGVLAGSIADHEPDPFVLPHEEVAGCLGGPGPGGVGRDSGEVDSAGVEFDEEQDVESAEGDGVDAEEVVGDHGVGRACDEFAPGWSGPVGCGFASVVSEDFPDGGGGDAVSEAAEFAVDTAVAPRRVVCVEAEHEPAELGRCGWSAGSRLWWLGPVAGHKASVPTDHRVWFDDQHHVSQSLPVEGTR